MDRLHVVLDNPQEIHRSAAPVADGGKRAVPSNWPSVQEVGADVIRTHGETFDSLWDVLCSQQQTVVTAAERVVNFFSSDLLPCSSFGEFCDLMALLPDLEREAPGSTPDAYVSELVEQARKLRRE